MCELVRVCEFSGNHRPGKVHNFAGFAPQTKTRHLQGMLRRIWRKLLSLVLADIGTQWPLLKLHVDPFFPSPLGNKSFNLQEKSNKIWCSRTLVDIYCSCEREEISNKLYPAGMAGSCARTSTTAGTIGTLMKTTLPRPRLTMPA